MKLVHRAILTRINLSGEAGTVRANVTAKGVRVGWHVRTLLDAGYIEEFTMPLRKPTPALRITEAGRKILAS